MDFPEKIIDNWNLYRAALVYGERLESICEEMQLRRALKIDAWWAVETLNSYDSLRNHFYRHNLNLTPTEIDPIFRLSVETPEEKKIVAEEKKLTTEEWIIRRRKSIEKEAKFCFNITQKKLRIGDFPTEEVPNPQRFVNKFLWVYLTQEIPLLDRREKSIEKGRKKFR